MVELEKNSSGELKKRIRKRNRGKKNELQKVQVETHNVEENADEIKKKLKKVKKLQERGETDEDVEAKEKEEEVEDKMVVVAKGIMTNETFESLDLSEQTFEAIKAMDFKHMTQVRKTLAPFSHVYTRFSKTSTCF